MQKLKYELSQNIELSNWLKNAITYGYHAYMDMENIQKLINIIANWYELKYPERYLKQELSGITSTEFENITNIADAFTLEQLLYRLPASLYPILKCEYRGNGGFLYPSFEKNKKVSKPMIAVTLYTDGKAKDFLQKELSKMYLFADPQTGKIENPYDLKKYIGYYKELYLDELLTKILPRVDITELEKTIYDHDCDLELRHRILQLVALRLLYSKNSQPKYGYERAKRFIQEFNESLNLTLSTQEIDERMAKDFPDISITPDEKYQTLNRLFNCHKQKPTL